VKSDVPYTSGFPASACVSLDLVSLYELMLERRKGLRFAPTRHN